MTSYAEREAVRDQKRCWKGYWRDYYLANKAKKNAASRANYSAKRDYYRRQRREYDARPENKLVKITALQFRVSHGTARDWLLFNFVDWKSRPVRKLTGGRPSLLD